MVTKNGTNKEEPKLKVTKLTDLANYEEGTINSAIVLDKKAASIAVYAFDKFQEIVEHILPYDALFYVLEGDAEVDISGKTYTIKTGEMIMFPANKPHSINTKSRFKMLLVSLKE
jgi:quercetin dioxygenase-like cupin family protein